MTPVFADTFFWIALANPRDEWHYAAKTVQQSLNRRPLFTTDEVLAEMLTFFCRYGAEWRAAVSELAQAVLLSTDVTVLPQTHDSFSAGLQLYKSRLDKQFSLTDCISMATMRKQNIQEVLTHDEHFAQEGFILLLK